MIKIVYAFWLIARVASADPVPNLPTNPTPSVYPRMVIQPGGSEGAGGDDRMNRYLRRKLTMMGAQAQTPEQKREAAARDAAEATAGWDVGSQVPSAAPPTSADWDQFKYSDATVFAYGGRGAGNIGNGLCTQKNQNSSQVKRGYCQILSESLRHEGSCANREMNKIIGMAGPSGKGFGGMDKYCSTWNKMNGAAEKSLVFQQILSGLITQESGWKPTAAEGAWFKGKQAMGGKGLFQIGVNDKRQDPDCAGLTESSIRDPGTNIKCGACIALKNMAKDRTMGHGRGDRGARGAARYFGPFRDAQAKKRNAIASGSNQYCRAATGHSGAAEQQKLAAVTGWTEPARAPASRAPGAMASR